MATTSVAYGSISIIDVTDIGELSVYPKSNSPLSVIYDPDQNVFTPNWGNNNLVLTPSIWYAGESLTGNSTGVSVTWTRQEGTSSAQALTTGETVSSSGVLTVSANKFTANSTMLTYIVTVSYREPTSGQTLTAQGQITFSMIKQATMVKSASITGGNVFLFDGEGNVKGGVNGTATITLTGRVTGSISISKWQYKNSSGNFVDISGSSGSATINITSSDSTYFINDICTIKLVTTDANIFDIHTISKLKDGAAGSDTISAVLTNDNQMIPYTGNVGDFSSAVSRIIIYESGVDVTNQWTITQPNNMTSNVTFTASTTTTTNDTITVTGMSGDSGYVTFKASQNGHADIIKRFSLTKVSSGQAGESPVIHSIDSDTLVLNKNKSTSGEVVTYSFTPSSVTFYSYETVGSTKTSYNGVFKIYENVLASEITSSTEPIYTSLASENHKTYTPSGGNCNSIVCVLYTAGGGEILDTQTIAVTTDGDKGEKGENGDKGEDALNVLVGNSYDGIPVDSNGLVTTAYPVIIPFAGYQGTTKVATTVEKQNNHYPTLFGIYPSQNNISDKVIDATTSSDGEIRYIIPAGTSVLTDSGTVTFTFRFTQANKTATYVYSWGKNPQSEDGKNAVLLQLSTPNGNYFENGLGTLTIKATVYDGTTDVSSSSTYQWAKYNSGSYTNISGATSDTLSVSGSTVDGYASYRCIATYDNNSYTQYMSLIDKTDPLQVTVLSSIGDKLINGNGVGALYAIVYRRQGANYVEVDPIKSERFVTTLPSTGTNGDYCYLLNSTNKTVTLYKYTTSWGIASDTYAGRYQWFYRDSNGNSTTTGTPSSGDVNDGDRGSKVIYIDGDLVDKKLVIDVKVTI